MTLALAIPLKLLSELLPDDGVTAARLDAERLGHMLDRATEGVNADFPTLLAVAEVDDGTIGQLGVSEATTPLVILDIPADVNGARNDNDEPLLATECEMYCRLEVFEERRSWSSPALIGSNLSVLVEVVDREEPDIPALSPLKAEFRDCTYDTAVKQ